MAVHARDGTAYDYRRKLLTFSVTARERGVGLYFPRHTWSFSGPFVPEGAAEDPSQKEGYDGRTREKG